MHGGHGPVEQRLRLAHHLVDLLRLTHAQLCDRKRPGHSPRAFGGGTRPASPMARLMWASGGSRAALDHRAARGMAVPIGDVKVGHVRSLVWLQLAH